MVGGIAAGAVRSTLSLLTPFCPLFVILKRLLAFHAAAGEQRKRRCWRQRRTRTWRPSWCGASLSGTPWLASGSGARPAFLPRPFPPGSSLPPKTTFASCKRRWDEIKHLCECCVAGMRETCWRSPPQGFIVCLPFPAQYLGAMAHARVSLMARVFGAWREVVAIDHDHDHGAVRRRRNANVLRSAKPPALHAWRCCHHSP